MDAVKKDVYNTQIKNIGDKIPHITNIATKTTLNAKINEIKGEIPSIPKLATTSAIPTGLNSLKSTVDTSNVNKLVPGLVDLSKLHH